MANVELAARLHCSYKGATFILCAGNLVVALYLLQSVVGPFYFQTSSSSSSSSSSNSSNELQQQGDHTAVAGALQQEVIYSEEDLKRQEESNDLRRAVLPVRLMERIKEIEAQTEMEISKSQSASAARQRVALELAQRLRYLRFINSKSNPQQGVILCHSFFECKFGVARSWGVVNSLVINLAMVICFLLFLVCLFSSVLSLSLATLLLNNNNNNTGSRIHKSSN
jgi:hypothetical protein